MSTHFMTGTTNDMGSNLLLEGWQDKYSVKIKKFDDQHRTLIELIAELGENIRHKKEKSYLTKIMSKLMDYTVVHFGEEEFLMNSYDYPDFESHKAEHRKIIEELKSIRQRIQAQGNLVNIQLLQFLQSWLLQHIMVTDLKYSDFFTSKGF